eukprot:TRINITY_DN5857_c0_g1_i1.p1 TRINITY_DN5857_c0_g1~~TRINITY_DN5857_c0_g1_i1.p1  ORF type:complete len:498 (+),score=128.56 TRINITY_DN5857_c0_g1_i1:290-1783(+)
MEEEVEKLAALKKAYADIILNIAKEAAARILISERKTLRFQQDVFDAKEEALNMLLRLKKVMDSKIAEAETASLGQGQKVQELEAQLNEAEETVVDLRTELRRVQDELEKLKNNLVKPMDERRVKGTEHVKSPSGDRCCFVFENATTPTEPLDDLPSGHYYDSNTDLATIAARSKEPELYKNGWTQRIRALEENQLTGNSPLHGQNDDGNSHTKNELMVGDGGIMQRTCTLNSPKIENMEKSKEMVQYDSSYEKGGIVRFFRRTLRKRAKYDLVETITCGTADKPAEAQVSSAVIPSEFIRFPRDGMIESDENPSKVIGEEAHKDSNSHFAPVSTKDSETVKSGKCNPDIPSENEDPSSHLPMENVQNDKDCYEQKLPDTSDVSICKTNLGTVDVQLVKTDSKDEKPAGTVGAPTQAINDKLLKYTFRRKRKRLPLSTHNDDCSTEKKSSSRRNSGDKQGPLPEPQKPTLVMESSRDSRRLVQVARQLISLSGKRWC